MERRWAEDEQSDRAKFLKEERNRRENYQKRKETLNDPIVMPEESKELSDYEKIREINMRNEALAAAGFDWRQFCI